MKNRNAFRGGSYALVISAVVLAILVVVNLFASALPPAATRYDISASKLYSITSNTKVVVNALNQDVTIYWVVQSGEENQVIENLLSKYDSLSDHITVVKKNPDVYPTFAEQYTDETVQNNSLIVECGERSRFIGYDDIFVQEPDIYSYSYSTSFDGEDSSNTYCAEDVYFTRRGEKSLPLGTDRVDGYLRKISDLNSTNYVTYNVTDEELTTYGLDAPELTVTVEYTPKDEETAEVFVLHISRDPKESKKSSDEDDGEDETVTAYLWANQSPIIYQISSDQYKNLMAASYDDLRHLEVFTADFADVRQIDISLEGDSYTLTSEENGKERTWFCQEEELEIDELKKTLEALRADEFTSEQPSQKEEIGLTIHLDNAHFPTVSIRLYRYDGTHCLAVADGESVALVNRGEVVDLIEAIHEIVLN